MTNSNEYKKICFQRMFALNVPLFVCCSNSSKEGRKSYRIEIGFMTNFIFRYFKIELN